MNFLIYSTLSLHIKQSSLENESDIFQLVNTSAFIFSLSNTVSGRKLVSGEGMDAKLED